MERLTKRDTDGQAMMDCEKCEADWTGKHGKPMADCTALYCRNRLLDRLAEYEDTEETLRQLCRNCDLERLEKLAEADKDGRLVVLPCKVGDTVYRLQYIEQTPGRFVVGVAEIKFALLWLEEFGETVFLTREEAEAALEAMKND